MTTKTNTASLTLFGADIIHSILQMQSHTVRSWRSRGFFNGGEKVGRGYVYNIVDIAKLLILDEMQDVGVDMFTASTGANLAALDLVAHALRQAPLIELWASPGNDIGRFVNHIRTDEKALQSVFREEMDFQIPYNYLITGGDDFDDWKLISDLSEIDELEEYNLVTIFVDLRKLAVRLINIVKGFPEASGGLVPKRDVPPSVATFYTKDCMEGEVQIVQFSLNMTTPPVLIVGEAKPDLKAVQ